ncbi:MAG: pectate lyase [Ignavibacteriales bacterium]|nr:MAG: pectate lyase [Ignavibacteriales bacterium]
MIKSFLSLVLFPVIILSQALSFPGAEGYGRFTTGGRGGKVIEVTNLNDAGPGSLRAAIKKKGPRTIVFKVSGTISLKSDLAINNGDLTIAGQTAPGDGICIKNYKTTISADNVIIRFVRFRLGDETKNEDDSFGAMNCKNIIIDHCTASWGIDENASFYDNENFTMQWCLISEALNNSYHHKGAHGYGGIWGGVNASFHHNLFADNSSRNPRFNGARTATSQNTELVDFRNNVIFNWEIYSVYGGEKGKQNVVANYYKPGPASKHKDIILTPFDTKGKWFVKDNYVESNPVITKNNWMGVDSKSENNKSDMPFGEENVLTQTPEEAYNDVLNFAGVVFPKRDEVDNRIILQVKDGKEIIGNGIINSQAEVGGYPQLNSTVAPADSDHDGMPDEWEKQNNLNPHDPEDRNNTTGDGYTILEKYLNHLVEQFIKK